MPTAKLRQ